MSFGTFSLIVGTTAVGIAIYETVSNTPTAKAYQNAVKRANCTHCNTLVDIQRDLERERVTLLVGALGCILCVTGIKS